MIELRSTSFPICLLTRWMIFDDFSFYHHPLFRPLSILLISLAALATVCCLLISYIKDKIILPSQHKARVTNQPLPHSLQLPASPAFPPLPRLPRVAPVKLQFLTKKSHLGEADKQNKMRKHLHVTLQIKKKHAI